MGRRCRRMVLLLALAGAGCGSFEGLNQDESGGWVPADTQIAVSGDRIVQTVNVHARIWSRNPRTLIADFPASGFFGGFLCNPLLGGMSDPRIRFDPFTGRWFVLATETT